MRTSTSRRQVLVPLLLLLLVATALAAPAAAHAREGKRWPGRTITYYDATRDKVAVRRAVIAWNSVGARIRFRRTFNRRRANIVIRNTRQVPAGCGTGQATLGYPGRGRQGYVNILHGYAKDGQGCAWPGQTFVVTHELGHVLGLDHDDRACALMNASHTNGVAASRCLPGDTFAQHRAQWRCRLIEARDARRVVRKYGGRMRPRRRNPWCNLVPYPRAPAPLTVQSPENMSTVTVTLHRPNDYTTPPYLKNEASASSYELHRTAGSCLASRPALGNDAWQESAVAAYSWSIEAGGDEVVVDNRPEPAGPWCWAAWTIDQFGRASAAPATATVDIAALPGAAARAARSATRRPMSPGAGASTRPRSFGLSGDTH
ncbi:MAG: hypothetical protein KDC46_07275 [Thermoleophilia bacterium]|nr:hypothetical protein [Thermoleophilia bacterium]